MAAMPRRRLRTLTLWTGSLLSLLIAAAFVVSTRWTVAWSFGEYYGAVLYKGCFEVTRWPDDWRERYSPSFRTDGIELWETTKEEDFNALVWWTETGTHMWGIRYARLPIWIALTAVAVPTLLIWRFGRKPIKPGHCRCGYDLRGLPEPRCPECGEPFEARGDAP